MSGLECVSCGATTNLEPGGFKPDGWSHSLKEKWGKNFVRLVVVDICPECQPK